MSDEDKKELSFWLVSKPVSLYVRAIEIIASNNQEVTFEKIQNLLKTDVKIRGLVWKIISPIEEAIRNDFCDSKKIEYDDWEEFKKLQDENFSSINKKINLGTNKHLDIIRNLRNDVSHLVYPILYGRIDSLINDLTLIKNFAFVFEEKIDEYLKEILSLLEKLNLDSKNY